jgi:small subunit ribosomal protein S9
MSEIPTLLTIGRRKRATARIRLVPGTGKIIINGRPLEVYFPTDQYQTAVKAPLITLDKQGDFDVAVNVRGGGNTGQAGAISLGIARALQKHEAEWRGDLKKAGLLKRDPREKERKKTGQPGARKKFQFSKR